jgi:hypothetical protein
MFSKYFKPGQKVHVRLTSPDNGAERLDTFSASCHNLGDGFITLALPYPMDFAKAPAMAKNAPLEVLSANLGLGLRAGASFHSQPAPEFIRLRLKGDLQLFQRRPTARLNTPIGVRYTRVSPNLSTARQQWEKHIQKLTSYHENVIPELPRGIVNLSCGGIRLGFRNPMHNAELRLMLLQIEPRTAPICALAEVVWSARNRESATYMAGLRFLSILAEDQRRITKFIRDRQRDQKKDTAVASPR